VPRRYSTREVIAALEREGFAVVRQQGSHIRLRGTLGGMTRSVTVVAGQAEITHKTLHSIRNQLGLTRAEFEQLVGR
jgi:predicted RNA binding protein YcfA (HicA-like mRNA interferase family)